MRRLLFLLGPLLVLLTACGSSIGGSSAGSSAPPPAPPAASTTAPGGPAMTEHSMSAYPMSAGADMTEDSMPGGAQTSDQSGPAAGPVITVGRSDFGPVLFDRTGQAIYLFDKETDTRPDCYDQCSVAWPPVLTTGAVTAGTGVAAGLLATTPRTDGTIQVTYAGHPLYFYANEGKDQVTCNNVGEFGGVWLAVTPNGDPVPG